MIVSGKISVKAILENDKRDIKRIILLEGMGNKDVGYIKRISQNYPIETMSREAIDELAKSKTHGGYAIEVEKRRSDEIKNLDRDQPLALMCIEGLRDPYNLGEIMRTANSLGFDGIITSDYDFYDREAQVIRSSAGASEKLWWLQSANLKEDIWKIKKNNITLIGAHRNPESVSLQELKIDDRFCFVLGGAMRGLSRKVLDECEKFARIDYKTRTSLSTAGACTVFAYEYFRQKGE